MKAEDTGPLYARIGEIIAECSEDPNRKIFYYLTVYDGVLGQMLVEDRGDHLFSRSPPFALIAPAQALWDAQEGPDRWCEMSYVMEGGKFHASLVYADQIDPAEDEFERALRVAHEVLGNKPSRSALLPPTGDGGYTFKL